MPHATMKGTPAALAVATLITAEAAWAKRSPGYVTTGALAGNQVLAQGDAGGDLGFKGLHAFALLDGKSVDLLVGKANVCLGPFRHRGDEGLELCLCNDEIAGPVVEFSG